MPSRLTCGAKTAGPRTGATRGGDETGLAELDPESAILADVGAILWEADLETWEISFISPHVERLLGFPAERFRSDREFFLTRVHPDDRAVLLEAVEIAVRRGGAEAEYRILDAADEPRWFRDVARLVEGPGGTRRFRGVLLDITDRKHQEEWRLTTRRVLEMIARGRDAGEVLEAIVSSSEAQFPGVVCSVLVMDAGGRLRSGPAPSLPESYRKAVDGLEPGPVAGSCGTAAFRRQRVVVEDIATDPLWSACRGLALPLGLRACWSQPILSVSGEPLGTFAVYRRSPSAPTAEEIDLLENAASMAGIALERRRGEEALRESEEHLRQAQKMEAVGRLAGGVAHDFNNLLTAILGHAETLERGLDPGDPRSGHARGIVAAADRGSRLTRQLLAVSRKHVLVPRVFELNGVVEEMGTMLRRLIGEHIELVTRLDPATGRVKADVGQIEQVVINLALNARDAMPEGGRLVLATTRTAVTEEFVRRNPGASAGDHCLLTVTDDGIGMDEGTRARIFEPFFTTKAGDRGTGLGLATVYGIVKQSGGNIWVESEPGRGTTFRIYFPCVAAAAPAEVAPPASASLVMPRGREKVLLVEDGSEVREILEETLRLLGYTVLSARDGDEGLRLSQGHAETIDLLVTDVVMPGIGGRELARAVLRARPGIRVLFVSGYTESAVQQSDLIEPGVDFLQKPFSPSTLARKVREVLDRDTERRTCG